MDGHILVDKELSVSEGHNIAETVRRELIKSWENIEDILIHVDTEDDSDLVSIYPTSSEELKKIIRSNYFFHSGCIGKNKSSCTFYKRESGT